MAGSLVIEVTGIIGGAAIVTCRRSIHLSHISDLEKYL